MNEEALNDSFNLFASNGYNGDLESYKELISTNTEAFNDSYSLFKSNGYNGSGEDFSSLVGIQLAKTNDPASADPAAGSNQNNTGSQSENGLSELKEPEPISNWQSIKNSFSNMFEQVGDVKEYWFDDDGANSSLDIATNAVYSAISGQENIDEYVKEQGKDSWTAEGLGSEATLEAIKKYEIEQGKSKDTRGIIESFKDGDIGGVLAGTVNALTSMVGSVAYGAGTLGTGFFSDYVAENYIEYNKLKAKNLGMTLGELITSGEADNAVPIGMGALSTSLELIGMGVIGKGVKGAVKGGKGNTGLIGMASKYLAEKLIYNKGARAAMNVIGTGTTEFTTEILQHASDQVNLELGRVAGTDEEAQISKTFIDAVTSEEGLEAGLQGFIGGSGMTIGSYSAKAMNTIRNVVDEDAANKSLIKLGTLEANLKAATDPTVRKGIEAQIEAQTIEISDLVNKGTDIYNSLDDGDISKIENLRDLGDAALFQVTELGKKLRRGDISQKQYELSKGGFEIEYKAARQGLIDMELEKNLEFAKKEAESKGLKFKVYETTKAIQGAVNKLTNISKEDRQEFKDSKGNIHGFAIGNQILINKEVAAKEGAINVGSHEVLHPVFNKLIGNVAEQGKIVKQFRKSMTSTQRSFVDKQMKNRGYTSPTQYNTEYINVFADALRKKQINYDKTTFEKIGDAIVSIFKPKGYENVSFDNGQDVYNFIKEYDISAEQGQLTGKAAAALKDVDLSDAGLKSGKIQLSKSVAEAEEALQEAQDADPNDPRYFDNLDKAEAELDAAEDAVNNLQKATPEVKKEVKPKTKVSRPEKPVRTSELGPRDSVSKKIMDNYSESMEGVERPEYKANKPLPASLERKLIPLFEGYINTIVQQKFRQLGPEALEFQDALSILRAEVVSAIRTYNPAKNKDLAGYVKKIIQTRQSLMFKDANAEFTSGLEDAKGVTSTEDVQSIDRSGAVERGQATFDQLDIVDDKLISEIESELSKELKMRAAKGTLSEMISVKKGRETYFVTWLEDYVNKQLFKKILKKWGAIGEKNGVTVIPPGYIDFLNSKEVFDIVTKALPIRTIKKSYAKLFKIEKVGREKSAEGNPIFKIAPTDPKPFLQYFLGGKKNTILERQKQLAREIITPVVKEVVANYATEENLSNLKEIQELAPKESVDVVNNMVLEAGLNNLESQIDRYKGEQKTFDIIQFSLSKNEKAEIADRLSLNNTSNLTIANLVSQIIGQTLKPLIKDRKQAINDIEYKLGPELYAKVEETIIGPHLDSLLALKDKKSYQRGLFAEQLSWDAFKKVPGVKMVSKRPSGNSGSSAPDIVIKYNKETIIFEIKSNRSDRITSVNVHNYTNPDAYKTTRNTGTKSEKTIFKELKNSKNLNSFIAKVDKMMAKFYPEQKKYTDKNGAIELTPEQIDRLNLTQSLYKETSTEIKGLDENLVETIYNKKGANYIGFADIGTFYVGENKNNLKVPKFEVDLYTRSWLYKSVLKANGKHSFPLRMFAQISTASGKKLAESSNKSIISKESIETVLQPSKTIGKDLNPNAIQFSLTGATNIEFRDTIRGRRSSYFEVGGADYTAELYDFSSLKEAVMVDPELMIKKMQEVSGGQKVTTKEYKYLTFDRDGDSEIIGAYDAEWNGKRYVYPESDTKQSLAVFGSLVNYFLGEIKKSNLKGISFTAAEPSRQRLYNSIAERFSRQIGWNYSVVERPQKEGGHVYFIAKPSKIQLSKSNSEDVKKAKTISKEFNDIIQSATGMDANKIVSEAKGKILGKKKGRFRFFLPPSADDFAGLLYKLLGKNKEGDTQQAWFKKNLFDPFGAAMQEFESYKQNVTGIVNQLKKEIKKVPSALKKTNSTGFTNEVAVRVYLWAKNGHDIKGLTKTDKKELIDIVEGNSDLIAFATQMDTVLNGYPEPQNDWLAGTITTDAINMINTTKRAEFLQEWQANADAIFTEDNLNKLRAAFGENYVEAMKDMLYRMKTGRNRPSGANKLTNNFNNWVNDSVGTIMFFNTRSALLQTLSIVNFINWGDNNPIQAAKAFANQKQFWSDFSMLFNSDFLKQRRSGLKNDVNADDIANVAETATNKSKAVFASILKMGFLPTQMADSFAIAMGGASFVRNRISKYVSEGMDKKAAEEKAFLDFQEIAEETQQSSRPDRISQQQASPLGRIVLAFANTPMQYMRLTKKAFLDLKNGRGDAKTNITKIIYYSVVQNVIFSALQSALFAAAFQDDDEEAIKDRELRIANSMLDSILRGAGVYGAVASTLKNIVVEIGNQASKDRPDFTVAAQRALSISPPIDSKMRKIMGAARAFSYKTTRDKMKGFGLDNPAYYATGQVVSAAFNLPLDRVIRKADNLRVAVDNDTKLWQSIALSLGYSQWDVGLVETSSSKKKSKWGSVKKWKRSTKENSNWKSKKN